MREAVNSLYSRSDALSAVLQRMRRINRVAPPRVLAFDGFRRECVVRTQI